MKRIAETDLTKDNAEDDDERFPPVDTVQRATQQVMAGRTIAKPRRRGDATAIQAQAPQPAANPFASVKTAPAEANSANPFSFLSGNKANTLDSFAQAAPSQSVVSNAAEPPSAGLVPQVNVKIQALNSKFAASIARYLVDSPVGNWSDACEKYLATYKRFFDEGVNSSMASRDVSMNQASQDDSVDIEPSKSPEPVNPAITSQGFKFGNGNNDSSGFKFGGRVVDNKEPIASAPVQGGFVFKPEPTHKKSSFSFSNPGTASQPIEQSSPISTENDGATSSFGKAFDLPSTKTESKPFSFGSAVQPDEKPSFNFGASSGKPETTKSQFSFGGNDKPSFSFETGDKPKFDFGAKAESASKADTNDKPQFSFGTPSEDKPKFSFGTPAQDKPKFSFGASSSDQPKFAFGQPTQDKPAFAFGGQSSENSWKPGDAIKFEAAKDSEEPEESEQAEPEDATDYTSKGPGEEDEEAVYEKRAKVFEFKDGAFTSIGLGVLRVLVNQENKKARVLVRADGSGRVLLNVGLRHGINYNHEGKGQVKILDFVSGDKPPVTYLVRVKTGEDGEELASKLEASKS